MANYKELIDQIKPYATDAVNPVITDCIKRSVIEFCRRSRIWRDTINIKLKQGKLLYTFSEQGSRVEEVLSGFISSDKLSEQMEETTDEILSSKKLNSNIYVRYYYSQPSSGNNVRVYPIPDSSHVSPNCDFYCVLVPTRQSSTYPDFIMEEWYEGIIAGSVYNLLRIPSKPWTNVELALHHYKEFHGHVTSARQESVTQNWTEVRVRPRPWT